MVFLCLGGILIDDIFDCQLDPVDVHLHMFSDEVAIHLMVGPASFNFPTLVQAYNNW